MTAPGARGADSSLTTIRLHITPFAPSLLPAYIPPSVQALATDISFHTIETFPDRPFGFVSLPAMEAAALKKKLNRSIVKGAKVRVEDARPEESLKRKSEADEPAGEDDKKAHKKRRSKRVNDTDGVLEGFELPAGRKVKRGWAEPESKKHKKGERKPEKTKYGRESEMLFRTKLPKNRTEAVDEEEGSKVKDKKKDKTPKKKSSREVVVHEFEHTTKTPTFLKKQVEVVQSKPAHEYVAGKGWVDEDGNLVDDTKPRRLRDEQTPAKLDSSTKAKAKKGKRDKKPQKVDASDKQENAATDHASNANAAPHPLETLFKRSKDAEQQPEPTAEAGAFSFFEPEDDGEEEEDEDEEEGSKFAKPSRIQIPSTPFEPRGLRSGAPTPDTAAVFKRFSFSRGVVGVEDKLSEESDDDSEQGDEEGDEQEEKAAAEGGEKEESPFAKWFWEKRGDNNRAWKKRRKDALSEKRRRENKRLGRRVV